MNRPPPSNPPRLDGDAEPADFGILLGLAYQTCTDELRSTLRAAGFDDLGTAYGYVFRALASEPLHLNELATRLGITNQGTVKIVNEMEARGYVTRRADAEDGRAKFISLAPRGRSALTHARRFHAEYERRLARRFGKEDARQFRELLERLIATTGTEAARARLRAL
jgi:MarR family transcriptional regulator for hemolysin